MEKGCQEVPINFLKFWVDNYSWFKVSDKMTGEEPSSYCNFRHFCKCQSGFLGGPYCCLFSISIHLKIQQKSLQLYWSLWVGSSMTPNIFFKRWMAYCLRKKYIATKTDAMRSQFRKKVSFFQTQNAKICISASMQALLPHIFPLINFGGAEFQSNKYSRHPRVLGDLHNNTVSVCLFVRLQRDDMSKIN